MGAMESHHRKSLKEANTDRRTSMMKRMAERNMSAVTSMYSAGEALDTDESYADSNEVRR
jgi:hypothetical protein